MVSISFSERLHDMMAIESGHPASYAATTPKFCCCCGLRMRIELRKRCRPRPVELQRRMPFPAMTLD